MRLKLYILIVLIAPLALLGENYSMLSYGEAGWYGKELKNHRTANGEKFAPAGFTAAHRKLPFGTIVKVTNLDNNKSVTVRINDRGPIEKGKIIDLSKAAANQISFGSNNNIKVEIRVIKIGDNKKVSSNKMDDKSPNPKNSNLDSTPQIDEFKDISPAVTNNIIPNNGNFVIQVGAFKLSQNANGLKNSLLGKGFSSYVKNTTNYWRVFVGNFSSKAVANSSLNKLKRTIPDAFIKRL